MEMLYTLGLLLQNTILVNCLNYLVHLLLLAGIYSFARTYFSHRIGLMSMLIFYTVPWVGLESFLPYIDLAQGLYTFLALYALLNWIIRRHFSWLVMCGIMTGIGASMKYQGVHNVLLMGITLSGWLIWTVFIRKIPKEQHGRSVESTSQVASTWVGGFRAPQMEATEQVDSIPDAQNVTALPLMQTTNVRGRRVLLLGLFK